VEEYKSVGSWRGGNILHRSLSTSEVVVNNFAFSYNWNFFENHLHIIFLEKSFAYNWINNNPLERRKRRSRSPT
jgi:hypothetical protein